MKKRVIITLTFAADLDMVPGWGHQPKDWEDLVKRELTRNSHYNPKVSIAKTSVANYIWDNEKSRYVDPFDLDSDPIPA